MLVVFSRHYEMREDPILEAASKEILKAAAMGAVVKNYFYWVFYRRPLSRSGGLGREE